MLSAGDAVAVVQAAYRLEGSTADWLRAIASELGAALASDGASTIVRFDTRADALTLEPGCDDGGTPDASPGAGGSSRASTALAAICASAPDLVIASEHALEAHEQRWLEGGLAPLGDVIALAASDAERGGWLIGARVPRAPRFTAQHRTRWRDVAAQIGAAAQLRSALARHSGCPPSASPGDAMRACLRAAAIRSLASAASRGAESALDARAVWTAISEGRWSIVDRHESGERCLIVARRNEGPLRDPRGLTALEREVGDLAASGLSGKRVAYELGLSSPTVSQLLHRAARKLGVRGVAELSRTVRTLGSPNAALTRARASTELELAELGIAGADLVALSFPWFPTAPLAGLSAAEREVLRCVLRGDSNAEVAARRRTAVRTAANQVASIFRKVGVSSRRELLARLAV